MSLILLLEAEIPDYWIVNLVDSCVEVHRSPHAGHYQTLTTHYRGEGIRPLLFHDFPLDVGLLFG